MKNDQTGLARELAVLDALLKDKTFAEEMATEADAAYYRGQGQTPPPFLTPEDENATVSKPLKEEKIAMNLAGFYALEGAAGYLAKTQNRTLSEILNDLVNGRLSGAEEELFLRFANTAWKAGQPFRSMDRIQREAFTPFALLPKEEVEKDLAQVKAAARKVLEKL